MPEIASIASRTPNHNLVRAIGRWSLVALVVNSIIGSGIFGLPSAVADIIGKYSPYAVLAAGAGTGVIMGCFAEVASRFQEAGGPYLYARVAFGRFMGIQTAWMLWLGQVAAPAANANLFVIYLGQFWPHAKRSAYPALSSSLRWSAFWPSLTFAVCAPERRSAICLQRPSWFHYLR